MAAAAAAPQQAEAAAEVCWLRCEPERYEELLQAHVASARSRFAEQLAAGGVGGRDFTVYPSPPLHFRLRVKFLVTGNEGEGALEDPGEEGAAEAARGGDSEDAGELPPLRFAGWHEGALLPIESYPAASTTICDAMPRALAALSSRRPLRAALRGVNFLSTLSGDLLVTLVYERSSLGPRWQRAAEGASAAIGAGILAHSRGARRVVGGRAWVDERLPAPGGGELRYRQVAGSFSNPNGHMAASTLQWLSDCADRCGGAGTDLLELYCGNGNHTVCLSRRFRRVLGVEINRTLVAAAHYNLMQNGACNGWVLRAPSQDFCGKMLRHQRWRLDVQKYIRDSVPAESRSDGPAPRGSPGADAAAASELNAAGVDAAATRAWALRQAEAVLSAEEKAQGEHGTAVFDFGAVLCDPPRAGLDAVTRQLVARYRTILYISCNPEALQRDLAELCPPKGVHVLRRFAVFDHFPYTGHLECGVMLCAPDPVSAAAAAAPAGAAPPPPAGPPPA